jgi:DNA (cytosine-5)-methyltransferase 1
MHVIIVGAGEVGRYLAQRLGAEGNDIVIVEQDEAVAASIGEELDVQVVVGSATTPSTLERAGVDRADLLAGVTQNDEVNFIASLLAKDYGVPQNRPRVLAVGIRDDIGAVEDPSLPANGFLPSPTRDYPSIEDLFSDLVDENYQPGGGTEKYPSRARNSIQKSLRTDPRSKKVRSKSSRVTDHDYSKHSDVIVEKFTFMIANNGQIPESMQTKKFAQRVLPAQWSEKGPTITATSLPDDYVHYLQPRSLTVREWARLQMFPDWYEFKGKRTTGGVRRAGNPRKGIHFREVPKYTQIGNAVPVKLAEEVGKHFQKILG